MSSADLGRELFAAFATPFSGEALFDCLSDVTFFIDRWTHTRSDRIAIRTCVPGPIFRRHCTYATGRRFDDDAGAIVR